MTLGLLTDTAFGLFVPAPASALQPPTGPQIVTVMSPAGPSLFHQNSGAEYLLNDDWQTLANKAGQGAAEQLASSLVDLANRHAGQPDLSPGLKRYLIQFVLLGGINPDDAADLVEDFAENPDDPRLEPVVRQIRQSAPLFAELDSPALKIIDGRVVPSAQAEPPVLWPYSPSVTALYNPPSSNPIPGAPDESEPGD